MMKTEALIDEATEMYATQNDVSLDHRMNLNRLMNQRLATAIDLQMQMKQAHWNVKGPSFIALHELFDKAHEAGAKCQVQSARCKVPGAKCQVQSARCQSYNLFWQGASNSCSCSVKRCSCS